MVGYNPHQHQQETEEKGKEKEKEVPAESSPRQQEQELDNIQLLLQRKNELVKNKAKFSITENDAKLLMTHSVELHLKDGENITKEKENMTRLYRIKSGTVAVSNHGVKFNTIGQGWFIGDTLLLTKKPYSKAFMTLSAEGPVILAELNLEFVKNLFATDVALSMRFMKYLGTKYTSLFLQIISNLKHPALLPADRNFSKLPDQPILSVPFVASRVSKPSSTSHGYYKVYNLVSTGLGVQTLHVKPKKFKIDSKTFGLHSRIRIPVEKLEVVTRLGEKSATIVYSPKRAVTVFFKVAAERDEFVALASSLVVSPAPSQAPVIPAQSDPTEEFFLSEEDNALYASLYTARQYKKGDMIFSEGDLFQRVYTILSGKIAIKQQGCTVSYLYEGQILCAGTLLVLRPASVGLEVESDTAIVQEMPGYKVFEMMEKHESVANKVLTNAAEIMAHQVGHVLNELDQYWK